MKFFISVVILMTAAVSALPQRCGASTRRLLIEGAPKKVAYRLYYFAPKVQSLTDFDNTAVGDFLRRQLGDETLVGNFWIGATLSVDGRTAENYLKSYSETDFAFIYENEFRKHQLEQMKGETIDGSISFRTMEMDNTPFLMKLSAAGRSETFLLSAFLGGCYDRGESETIKLAEQKTK